MQARVIEAQQAENHGVGRSPVSTGGAPSAPYRDDPGLIAQMVAEGWVEHNIEGA